VLYHGTHDLGGQGPACFRAVPATRQQPRPCSVPSQENVALVVRPQFVRSQGARRTVGKAAREP